MRAKREAQESHFMLMGMQSSVKGTPILGVGVSVDSQIFKEKLQGSKLIGFRSFLYH
jgi:hypothetical protein